MARPLRSTPSEPAPPQALLLAAGLSRRFGCDKTLYRLSNGMPMALQTARNMLCADLNLTVVIRPEQHELAELLAALPLQLALAPEAHRGMGASLAAGIRATSGAGGWLVALADMPTILPQTYHALLMCLSGAPPQAIYAPVYNGQRGHPVGFAAGWRGELLALDGDQGARSLLAQHSHYLTMLDCADPGVLQDMDQSVL